jgi:hypothetical protein
MTTIKTMKKINVLLLSIIIIGAFSCKKKKTDDVTDPGNGGGSVNTEVLKGDVCNKTLLSSITYLLKGQVFVKSGCTLTIQAGTTIKGDKATKGTLIIDVGGKIEAHGTAAKPIVFTSGQDAGARDEGDWGGVLLLGDATTNQTSPTIEGISPAVTYGGTDDADNSGTMTYCRIEFAGIALSPNNETNSLTFGGVGSGTTIDYIQSSFGGDDAFEWFGGTVTAKHLIAYTTWDDDFDTDFGFSGKVQYGVSIRDPFQADQSGSCGFESDNEGTGVVGPTPITSVVFSNITIFGPIFDSTKAISGNFTRGAHLRRNTNLSLYNSVIIGFPTSIFIEGAAAQGHYGTTAAVKGNAIINLTKYDKTKTTTNYGDAGTGTIWTTTSGPNDAPVVVNSNAQFAAALTAAGLSASQQIGYSVYPADPSFAVTSGTLNSNAATVPSGIDQTTYRGAFGATDWTDGWSEFDPKNANY